MVLTYTTKSTCSTRDEDGLAFGTQLGVLGVDSRVDVTAKRLGSLERHSESIGIHIDNMC